jgi:guanylate kinase
MQRGELYILSAPSGAGKTTLIHALLASELGGRGEVVFSVSYTTRPPRRAERDGVDYRFVGRPEFERMIAEGRFLEWAEVHGNYYGTSRDAVLPFLERGADVVVDLDVQGAERLMHQFPEAHSVFVLPPSYADLVRRLRGRGLDDPDQIARRLAVSLWEIRRYDSYQYVIVNDDVERAGRALAAIVLEKRQRKARQRSRIERVLADFQRARDEASET